MWTRDRQSGLRGREILAILTLIGLAVLALWRLALTELIVARGDLFVYFYPYRNFASEAVRSGHVPLWNPYLFMGAPFLANSQAGFFYPLNLILTWMPVERMVNASIVLHVSLASVGAFLWGRSGLGLSRSASWVTGVCYGLGGYFLAQVEHLNQVQVLAWLPWLLWLYGWYESIGRPPVNPVAYTGPRFAGMALVIAAQFLAGHTQSVFICLVGLAVYALMPPLWHAIGRRLVWRDLLRPLSIVIGVAGIGGALAAVQLLPTLELTRHSIRSGGLPYREAVSFSLRPELLGRALLPSWGARLFPEFVAYAGVIGLALAVVGVSSTFRSGLSTLPSQKPAILGSRSGQRHCSARRGALILAMLGLFLALGGFNPVYFLLVKLVPGFALFRAPARWLALYAVGVAGLAGIGFDTIAVKLASIPYGPATDQHKPRRTTPWAALIISSGIVAALILLGELFGGDRESELAAPLRFWTVCGWLLAALLFCVIVQYGPASGTSRVMRRWTWFLPILVVLELFAASHFLPIHRATAPGALTSLRPSVAYLLSEADGTTIGPPARFLSISNTLFDPGDKAEIELILGPQLPRDALYDDIVATKQKEVLIPNLPLYYRLPAVDGYDGGVLPLARYVTLQRLYMPEEDVAIDGRLRENLRSVPDGKWLSLFNVRFIVTDKVNDAWFDDVFYDLEMGARLSAGYEAAVGSVPALAATALGVVFRADGAAAGTHLADLDVTFKDGSELSLPLVADAGTGDRIARLSWGKPATPSAVLVRGVWAAGDVTIRGLSLIDERTLVFQSLILSDSGRFRLVHSGDVKIYENLDVLPRAFFVPEAFIVADDRGALAAMGDPSFDPAAAVVLDDDADPHPESASPSGQALQAIGGGEIEWVLYEPEHVIVAVNAPADGWLLLSDAWYPGWAATIDSEPALVRRADVLFRAVAVRSGKHLVEFVYRPLWYRAGLAVSVCALGLLFLGLTIFKFRNRRSRKKPN